MDARLLTDTPAGPYRPQLAQLATAAGARAPLAHVANQVSLSLAHELEGQQQLRRQAVATVVGLMPRADELKYPTATDNSAAVVPGREADQDCHG